MSPVGDREWMCPKCNGRRCTRRVPRDDDSCAVARSSMKVKASKTYRLVQIERPKLCLREFLTPFFRVRPRNFAHIFWTSLSKTRRGGFFNLLSRWPVIRGPGWST